MTFLMAEMYASGATMSGTVTISRLSDRGREEALDCERTAARTWYPCRLLGKAVKRRTFSRR